MFARKNENEKDENNESKEENEEEIEDGKNVDNENENSDIKEDATTKFKNIKYFYKINGEDDYSVELGPEATVKTMKESIAKEHEIDDILKIKIVFTAKMKICDALI